METVNTYLQPVLNFIQDGYGQLSGNSARALIIALVATVFMGSWKQWLPIGLMAAIVHKLIDFLAPMLVQHGRSTPQLPALADKEFWVGGAQLVVGYMLLIGVFFFLKKLLFRGGGAAAKAH